PLTTRVGISLTDNIDFSYATAQTVVFSKVGGGVLTGKISVERCLVNFTPDQPLQTGTTYEILLPGGGIRDWAGNPMAQDFRARFSTGPTVTGIMPFAKPQARRLIAVMNLPPNDGRMARTLI